MFGKFKGAEMQLTDKEVETIIKDLRIVTTAMAELLFVLEGAREGYYGGESEKLKETKRK